MDNSKTEAISIKSVDECDGGTQDDYYNQCKAIESILNNLINQAGDQEEPEKKQENIIVRFIRKKYMCFILWGVVSISIITLINDIFNKIDGELVTQITSSILRNILRSNHSVEFETSD